MTRESDSLVEKGQRLLDGVTARAVDTRNQLERIAGESPSPWGDGDDLEQLEAYLDMRDSGPAWAALFDTARRMYGRDGGEMDMATKIIKMEAMLDRHGGAEAVHSAMLLRRIRQSEPVLKQIERIDAMPEYEVRPALPGYDELSVLAAIAAGESPEFQPVIQTPADAMPPGGMMPYGT